MEVDQQRGEFMFQLDFFDLVRTDLFSSKTECRLIRTYVASVTYKICRLFATRYQSHRRPQKGIQNKEVFHTEWVYISTFEKYSRAPKAMQQFCVQEGSCEMSFVSTFDFTTTTHHFLEKLLLNFGCYVEWQSRNASRREIAPARRFRRRHSSGSRVILISNKWMRLSGIWRIIQIEEGPWLITPPSICIILFIIHSKYFPDSDWLKAHV